MFTLKYLLETYKVLIPQIQRDYAQGRENELELRNGFVDKINQTLQDSEPCLNLDFIYGYISNLSKDEEVFVPLDGQQRLTTLWLTHWWLAPRNGNEITEEVKEYLSKFTYETRLSSKRFCNYLIYSPLDIQSEKNISESITDAPWFMASWINDPTVLSMLNMLDTLQQKVNINTVSWDNLTKNNKITFDFIDIKSDEFKLTDELYIKMNSRGKPLTPFENFKAQFSELLASDKTDYINATREFSNTSVSYQQYFSFKIDSIWMDLFWSYREKTKYNIDASINNYISFIAEFLFFRGNPEATSEDLKTGFDFQNKVFLKKDNIDFLFNSLDFLSSLNDSELFFDELFIDTSTFDQHPKDFFYRAISNSGFEVKDKILFYAILLYCSNKNIQTPNNDLKDYVRIVRNLLLAVRQYNQSKRIEFISNLRLPNVSDYCLLIDTLVSESNKYPEKSIYQVFSENEFIGFTKEIITNEKEKADLIITNSNFKKTFHKLEDHSQIKGNTINFRLNSTDVEDKINTFFDIWNKDIDDSLIVRSLLTIGDYSVKTHEYSSLDAIWFFGCKDYWNRILTSTLMEERERISDILDKYLVTVINANGNTIEDKLINLIDNYQFSEKDWRYYFIKYKAISDSKSDNPNGLKLNLYTWQDDNGFNINHLGNSGSHPLHSYHINPFLLTLKQNFKGNNSVKLVWGIYTELSNLTIESKVYLRINSEGWKIKTIEPYVLKNILIEKYNLSQHGTGYLLLETTNKDRIEIASDFISDLLNN